MAPAPAMPDVSPLTRLRVDGMTCNNCARHVTEAGQGVPGVRSATVSLTAKTALIRWDPAVPKNIPAVIAAITQAGYDAREMPAADGEAGQSAARRARWQLNLWAGVAVTALLMLGEWGFNLMSTPWFRWLSFALGTAVQLGCGAAFYRGAWRQLKVGASNMDTLVVLGSTTAFGFSAWIMLTGAGTEHVYFMEAAAIISVVSLGHWFEARVSERASGALQSLLTLAPPTARRLAAPRPAATIRTARDLLSFKPGTAPSALSGVRPSSGAATSALSANVDRLPEPSVGNRSIPVHGPIAQPAMIPSAPQADPETEVETSVAELRPGDRIVLKPGDRVPTDGVVLTGESAVDEAMLTGESVPVDKKTGGEVYAGTVNLNGRLVVRVTATGEGTALARVIAAVQRAQTSRADIQRLGDRVSSVFVPVIVCIAAGAALWWGLAFDSAQRFHNALVPWLWHGHLPATAAAAAFIVAAAVFIVACPCAMGLATPAAIMAAANAAARRGILIRDGIALEKAGKVTTVVFDKTGTLTQGKPSVVKFQGLAQGGDIPSPGHFLQLAAALARNSAHPLSQAIARSAEPPGATGVRPSSGAATSAGSAIVGKYLEPSADKRSTPVQEFSSADKPPPSLTDWREISGSGVQAAVSDATGAVTVRLGSVSWLRASGVDMAPGEAFMAEWSAQGASLVGLAQANTLTGVFAIQDTLKPGAAEVVAQLRRQGLNICLLTGDNPLTAASIARQTGIPAENVFAGVRPDQKAARVKELQARGEKVAFVGDGINDAPALTQADLGIAVSRASDIARDAADIILLKSEIAAVPEALDLARATLRVIKQNLFWAFFYNALAVPLAAAGFASPVICAAAMGGSDLIVIGNALRLLRRPHHLKKT